MSSLCKVCGKWMDGNVCRNCGASATDVGKKTVGSTHCPTCNKLIDIDAPFCPYCGKSAEGEEAPERVKCAFCGKMMKKTAAFCPSCGKPPMKRMYKCPSCGREMEEDTPFCPGCGISREAAGAINKGVCINCGNRLSPDAVFCPSCGQSTGSRTPHTAPTPSYGAYAPYSGSYYVKSPSETLAIREKASGLVWLAVAIIQAFLAWYFFDNSWDWGEYTWISYAIVSLWNFSVAYQSFQRSKRVEARISGIVAEYNAMFTSCIVFIVINVLFGGIVGVAGAIFNLLNRNYALKNAPYLEER